MPIPELVPRTDANGNEIPTNVQRTSLGLDVIARFVCNTWEEATADSEGIDVVVLGAGMYGGYCASKIYQLSQERFRNSTGKALRVLVLDAGPFLIPEHSQNIPDLGLSTPSVFGATSIGAGTNPGTTNLVWGFGWRSNQPYSEQAYCIGGKGIYWGGWCPRLQAVDLAQWPREVRDYLTVTNAANPVGERPIDHRDPFDPTTIYTRGDALTAYETMEYEIGVVPSDDFVFDPANFSQLPEQDKVGLNGALHFLLDSRKGAIDNRIKLVLPAPIAVQTQSFVSGLFALDKYSSVPAMVSSARRDHGDGRQNDLRMSVVPFTHVVRLECAPAGAESPAVGSRLVNRIVVNRNGKEETLSIGGHCQVVLAMSCIESTRLALESFSLESSLLKPPGQELMGRNFMVHLRADITFRVERTKFAQFVATQWPTKTLAEILQLASLHIQCEGLHGTYQYQLYAATNADGPDANMYKMIPDLDIQNQIRDNFGSNHINFVLRSSGEVKGGRNAGHLSPDFDFIDLAGNADFDGLFGHRRAWVQFKANDSTHSGDPIWQDMHDTAHAIARALANGGTLDYGSNFFSVENIKNQQKLGTSWHDSGTLWMGDDPDASVTDVNGHFHHVTNAYCADQALFTTVGSANPVLTGLCLARKVADDIVARHSAYKAPAGALAGFQPVPLDAGNGWLALPYNGAATVGPGIVEMQPAAQGPGRQAIGFYYLPQPFGDFELYVEWKAFRTPVFPNSGVLLRMPDPAGVNFDDQTQFDAFYDSTVEIQIDDLGKDFVRNRTPQAIFGNARCKTGAIYGIAAATQWAGTVLAPDGAQTAERYWNVYQIKAQGNQVSVRLNGKPVSNGQLPDTKQASGFIGFQFHTGRVQFQNLRVKTL